MEFLFSVFTPTYNRANTIGRTYEYLCKQTLRSFEWIIVDDGSTDNTEEIVQKWINTNKISIVYLKQENGGKHRAFNRAVQIAKECICMFPEGTRSKDGKLHKGAPGVALIAAKSKATVIPVAIQGTFKLRPFRKITLIYGKPMTFEAEKVDKENLQEFTEKIMQEIASMLKIK